MAELAKQEPRADGRGLEDAYTEELPTDIEPCRQLLINYSGIPADQVEQHIRIMRAKAWAVYKYPCVGRFRFLQLSISRHPLYSKVLARLTAGTDTSLLDMGCCFAQDLRKLAADGAPSERLYGADLRLEFLDLGYELFRDRGRIKATFYAGNALAPVGSEGEGELVKLDGKIDIIHAASFLHLFGWDEQIKAAVRMVKFLKEDAQDALIFGRQLGSTSPGNFARSGPRGGSRFSHDPATFQEMWDVVGQQTGTRWKVEASLHKVPGWTSNIWDAAAPDNTRLLMFAVQKLQ